MTPDGLAARGRVLYGKRWQSALARDLKVSDRTVRRWVRGDSPIPEHAQRDLLLALQERYAALREALSDMNRRAAPHKLHGLMRGSVVVSPGTDLTEPAVCDGDG